MLKHISFLFILFSTQLMAQGIAIPQAKAPVTPSSFLKMATEQCDSAAIHLKNKDTKGADKLYHSAIKDFKKAIKETPDAFDPYYLIGLAQTQTADYKEAIKNLSKAITIDTSHGEAFRTRGIAEAASGNTKDALTDLGKASSINYDDAQAVYQLGMLKEHDQDPDPAIAYYSHAIEVSPNFEMAYMKRGIMYYSVKKDYVLALNDFNKVIELNSENNDAYLWRGKTQFNGGDFKSADKDLSRYIDMEPDNVDALITRGASRININNNSGAVEDFDAVIKLDPKNYIAYMNRGVAKGGMKKFKDALADLDMAAKLKFDFSSIYINRAAVKFASGDKKGACVDLEKADGLNNEKAYNLIQQYCKDGNRQ